MHYLRERLLLGDFTWDMIKVLRLTLSDGTSTGQSKFLHSFKFLAKGPGFGVEWAK
jgi:hypothetical protein